MPYASVQGIQASEEFTKLVFDGGPAAVAEQMPEKYGPTAAHSKLRVFVRREEMERLLSQRSVDSIRQIETGLRTRSSVENPEHTRAKIKIPMKSHPLGLHERGLTEVMRRLRSHEEEISEQLKIRAIEEKELRKKWDALFKEINESLRQSSQKYYNIIEELQQKLEAQVTELDQLNQKEQDELEREIGRFHRLVATNALLTEELNALTLNQSISHQDRCGYFDYRTNYPLVNPHYRYIQTPNVRLSKPPFGVSMTATIKEAYTTTTQISKESYFRWVAIICIEMPGRSTSLF
ncbi:unnamed protein product [Echinostoma caproni]|uniref:DUF4200 domain-containing protein n=1 Tax=Echinostoma caproni TaxID=27848 RepID=A0A183ASD2_9TREM|nr:unnamed protein product [Echinostoma caproni]